MNHTFYDQPDISNAGIIAGQWQDTVYRANSAYRPAVGGSITARFFAAMAGLYNAYQVNSAKIWVKPRMNALSSSGVQANVNLCIVVSTDQTPIVAFSIQDILTLGNRGRMETNFLGREFDQDVVSASWSLRSWNGGDGLNGDHAVSAFNNNNPDAVWFFHILTGPASDDYIATSFGFDVKIQYNVLWTDPLTVV